MRLPTAVPLVWINPPGGATRLGRMVHTALSDPTDFGRRFSVHAPDMAAAQALLAPALRDAVMVRAHWAFQLAIDELVCVSLPGFATADDVGSLLRDIQAVVSGLPAGDGPPPPAADPDRRFETRSRSDQGRAEGDDTATTPAGGRRAAPSLR
jgi:hypothetical protein